MKASGRWRIECWMAARQRLQTRLRRRRRGRSGTRSRSSLSTSSGSRAVPSAMRRRRGARKIDFAQNVNEPASLRRGASRPPPARRMAAVPAGAGYDFLFKVIVVGPTSASPSAPLRRPSQPAFPGALLYSHSTHRTARFLRPPIAPPSSLTSESRLPSSLVPPFASPSSLRPFLLYQYGHSDSPHRRRQVVPHPAVHRSQVR